MFTRNEVKIMFALLNATFYRTFRADYGHDLLYVRVGDYTFWYNLTENCTFFSTSSFAKTEEDEDLVAYSLALEVLDRVERDKLWLPSYYREVISKTNEVA